MDTLSPYCGLVPSPPLTMGRLRPTNMWCRLSTGNEVAGVKTKVGSPVQSHRAHLWQSATPKAERDLHCIPHASHGRLSTCFLCYQLSAIYVYFCVALSEWSCREKENTLSL